MADTDDLESTEGEQGPLLRKSITSKNDVQDLTNASEMELFIKSEEDIKKLPQKGVRRFYRRQNEIIEGLRDISIAFMAEGATTENEEHARKVRFIVTLSFVCNFVLFGLKVAIAIMSGSLSVIASTIDSFLDLLSGSVLFAVARFMDKSEPYKYPEGKSRMEPLGIIVFAAVMGVTSLNIIKEALQTLISGLVSSPADLVIDVWTISVLVFVLMVKAALYMYCRSLKDSSGIVGALAEDHMNDVGTNLIATLAAVLAGEIQSLWWMDPIGAAFFGVWILISWVQAGNERIGMLVGDSAPPQLIGQLAFVAGHHDSRIIRVDTVRAFHFGERYLCEVDVVLPENMPLKESHDIGEALQFKLEKLSMIQRAYVHLDYEWDHQPEH